MNIALNWLRDYVALPASVAELVERLTRAGMEVARVQVLGVPAPAGVRVRPEDVTPVWAADKVLTAQVRQIDKHPNADKLKLVHLDYGAATPQVVVTGAPNIAVGTSDQKVIVGLVGTQYLKEKDGVKGLFELKPGELRGVKSDAMVMSEYELGLSDDHDGIIILDADAPVGRPATELLSDIVLEIELTPNLARCLAYIGVAREVAALTGGQVCLPERDFPIIPEATAERVRVELADVKLCPRYQARLIRTITVGPAPYWLQARLRRAGMRPINNVVDITNYVMLEWGQPLHAFDYDVLVQRAGGAVPTITVRPARAGETLVTLDGVERTLTPDHLLIADTAGPIALAGVMGGRTTEVTASTRNVLLESASFDFVSIRKTMRGFNLPSEASLRFSKGIHPDTVQPAADRAVHLLHKYASGSVCAGSVDAYPHPPTAATIALPAGQIRRLLGIEIPAAEVEQVLKSLEFGVTAWADGRGWDVRVPSHRLDVQTGAADLIEELARIRGYDRLPATLLADPLPAALPRRALDLEEHTRDALANAGLQEVITRALTSIERETKLGPAEGPFVTLLNPIANDRDVMRRRLLPGVLDVVADNLKHTDRVRLFEVGKVFQPVAGSNLPNEPLRLVLALTGQRTGAYWAESAAAGTLDFFDLKGVVEGLLSDLHTPVATFRPVPRPHLHPGRSAEVLVGTQVVGTLGQLHPLVGQGWKFGPRVVLVAEFDLDVLLACVPTRFPYAPFSTNPPGLRDIAVVVADAVPCERIMNEIHAGGGELLKAVTLFDVYRGPSIPAGTKSLAFALTYQALDRTLNDKDLDKVHKKIEGRLVQNLQAQIRGQEG
jgi:phenylalanyl-tRNA synthetase beta chain